MKATGEVMAIDRTFGAALNKALRGLEQAGAGPLAEDPALDADASTTSAAVYGARPGSGRRTTPTRTSTTSRSAGSTRTATACESTRLAQRSAAPIVLRRFLAPSDSRLWRLLGLLRRGVPEATIQEATGIAPWFLAEMGRNVALELEVRAIREPARGSDGRGRGGRSSPRPSGPASATASSPTMAGVAEADLRAARAALGLRPGYAMVDTCAAEFAAETPYFYSTYAAAGSRAGGAAGRPRRRRSSSAAARSGSGRGSSSTTARSRPPTRSARAGWQAVMINSNPETVSTDFDASSRLYFEPLDPESVLSVIEAETPPGVERRCPRSSRSAARRR